MLPSFHTERLLVRPLIADDLAPLFTMIYADPRVASNFTSYTTYAQVLKLHKEKIEFNENSASVGFGYWGVILRKTASLIGQVLLGPPEPMPWVELPDTSRTYPLGEEVELGYAFAYDSWGKGYATESCRVIARYALEDLKLKRLINSVAEENTRSIRLMERLGFICEPNLQPDSGVVGVLTAESFRQQA